MTPPTLPTTHPLPTTTPAEALEIQQRLVAALMRHFPDGALFRSDVGVVPGLGRPDTTARVERALAEAFGAPAAALVQGAGTGAIRAALSAGPWRTPARRLLVHDAPDYPTTATLFVDAGAELVRADANDPTAWEAALADPGCPAWVYLQHSRQQLSDSYDLGAAIELAQEHGRRVVVDDNYAAIRTPRIGAQLGAAASCFSLFKLHGPEGVAVVVGDTDLVEAVQSANYSGGGQVQGHQALDAVRSLVMVPLNWAAQTTASTELAARLKAGELPGVADATLANAQDLCVVALLEEPIAERVRAAAAALGAAPYPVGSNSRYEIAPLVYRMSSSSLAANPELAAWTLRINPMRASAHLVIDLLRRALDAAVRG
ncbi:MAG: aminotransferase class V-fold PLP-dependent enzyme [Actinobacteria bacterium]|nr:aminotransferase class V-fold PLP-dependent enzyme [Actinomycetota bacterium]